MAQYKSQAIPSYLQMILQVLHWVYAASRDLQPLTASLCSVSAKHSYSMQVVRCIDGCYSCMYTLPVCPQHGSMHMYHQQTSIHPTTCMQELCSAMLLLEL